MKFSFNKIFVSFTIILYVGCTEDPPNTNGDDNNDTIPTTMPQEHIPWPSLADSPWPMYMHDPQHTGRSPYEGPSEGEVNWENQLGYDVFSNPVIDIDGNILFMGNWQTTRKLFSVSNTGNLNWDIDLDNGISSPLITSDSMIYVTANNRNGDRFLAQLDQNGNLHWKYNFEKVDRYTTSKHSPNISKDGSTIYLCGFDHALYAINRDGILQWKYSIDPAESWGEPSISPNGNAIYFIGSDFKLYSVHKNGELNWSLQLDAREGWTTISPVIDSQGNIYLYSVTTFYSISPTGNIRWQFEGMEGAGHYSNGCTIGPDGTIYVTMLWNYYAFDYAGNVKWNMQLQDEYVDIQNIPVVDLMGNTYFGTPFTGQNHEDWYDINFVSFDSNGFARYKIHIGNGKLDIDSPGAIDGSGNLYVGSDNGATGFFSIR